MMIEMNFLIGIAELFALTYGFFILWDFVEFIFHCLFSMPIGDNPFMKFGKRIDVGEHYEIVEIVK